MTILNASTVESSAVGDILIMPKALSSYLKNANVEGFTEGMMSDDLLIPCLKVENYGQLVIS